MCNINTSILLTSSSVNLYFAIHYILLSSYFFFKVTIECHRPKIWQRRSRSPSPTVFGLFEHMCHRLLLATDIFVPPVCLCVQRSERTAYFAGLASDEQPAIWRHPVDTAPRFRGRLLRGGHPGVGWWSRGLG